MKHTHLSAAVAVLTAVLALSPVLPSSAADADRQQPFIALLLTNAPPAEKAMACKRLALYGDRAAVPALAALLPDAQLAAWARIALEAIPDPEAADALRAALGTLTGPRLVGVINSLGARRDVASIGALAGRLADADADVAAAAAAALGRIGGPSAVSALSTRLAEAPAAAKPALAAGCLRCAAGFLAAGQDAEAARWYDLVRGAQLTVPLTLEATRGLILARGRAGIPLLLEQLRAPEKAFFQIGLRTARELPGDEVAQALLAELPRAAPERQPYLLLTLADRGDAGAQSAAAQAARSGSTSLRIAAIAVLERLGDPASLPVLLDVAAETESAADVAGAARTALARWVGPAVEQALVAALPRPESGVRRAAIELIGQRQMSAALPALLQVAADADAATRAAALKVVGELAGSAQVPALVRLLLKADDPAAVEGALRAICARAARSTSGALTIRKARYGRLPGGPAADVTAKVAGMVKGGARAVEASNALFGDPAGGMVKQLSVDYVVQGVPGQQTVAEGETLVFAASAAPAEVVDPLCAALAQAPPVARLALLRILRAAGGPQALAAVRVAATDAQAEIRAAGLRLLCEWPSSDALPDLLELAKGAADPTLKILALRGALRLAQQPGVPADAQLAALGQAMSLAERDDERRLALTALGGLASADALRLVTPHLAGAGLKEEACLAAVSIAEKLPSPRAAPVADALEQVARTTANATLAQRAKALSGR